ncbi:MAG: iron-sulfur cluster assembly accessory protein, partial [Rhodospirillales bacterium]
MPDGTQNIEQDVIITDSAAARIARLRQIQGNDQLRLRITVNGRRCSGFQYAFHLDDKTSE